MMRLDNVVAELLSAIIDKVSGGDSLRVIDLTNGENISKVVVSFEVYHCLRMEFGSVYKEYNEEGVLCFKFIGIPVYPSIYIHKKEVILLGGRQ